MTEQPPITPNPFDSEYYSEAAFEKRMQDRRSEQRLTVFCQILDTDYNFVGISFDLSHAGICLSLPNTWTHEIPFSIILKRVDNDALPAVTITVDPIWRKPGNEKFDEIGGAITAIESPQDFETFLNYCESAGPSGL